MALHVGLCQGYWKNATELTQTLRVTSGFQKLCTWTSTYKQIVSLWNIFFIFCYRKADPSWWENMTKTSRIKKLRDNRASISWHTAVAVARSIIEVKDHANLHRYNFSEPWARSLFIRMNLSHRAVTTGKLTMPDCLISEVKMSFTREIAKLVTDN